jgi:hypothetical protein
MIVGHFYPVPIITYLLKIYLNIRRGVPYTGCPRRNLPDFRRVFHMLKYADITQNTYIQS